MEDSRNVQLTGSGAVVPVIGTKHAAVTPSDVNDFEPSNIYVGSGGDIALGLLNSPHSEIYHNVPDGAFLPLLVVKVYATGTTATDIIRLN